MPNKVYVVCSSGQRKPLSEATDAELCESNRVMVAKGGAEVLLTQQQIRCNVLLFCKDNGLPFSLANVSPVRGCE